MRFTVGEVNVVCADLERSLRSCRDGLGFDVVRRVRSGPLPYSACSYSRRISSALHVRGLLTWQPSCIAFSTMAGIISAVTP